MIQQVYTLCSQQVSLPSVCVKSSICFIISVDCKPLKDKYLVLSSPGHSAEAEQVLIGSAPFLALSEAFPHTDPEAVSHSQAELAEPPASPKHHIYAPGKALVLQSHMSTCFLPSDPCSSLQPHLFYCPLVFPAPSRLASRALLNQAPSHLRALYFLGTLSLPRFLQVSFQGSSPWRGCPQTHNQNTNPTGIVQPTLFRALMPTGRYYLLRVRDSCHLR